MLWLNGWLLSAGIAMLIAAIGILTYDARLRIVQLAPTTAWRTTVALAMLAWAPLLISAGMVSKTFSAPVSHTRDTLAGTLHER